MRRLIRHAVIGAAAATAIVVLSPDVQAYLKLGASVGNSVVGIDWRVPLNEARARLGPDVAVQGNLDPAVCLAPWPAVEAAAREVLAANGGRPGHVFNLGHGVLPETDPAVLERLVELVHGEDAGR